MYVWMHTNLPCFFVALHLLWRRKGGLDLFAKQLYFQPSKLQRCWVLQLKKERKLTKVFPHSNFLLSSITLALTLCVSHLLGASGSACEFTAFDRWWIATWQPWRTKSYLFNKLSSVSTPGSDPALLLANVASVRSVKVPFVWEAATKTFLCRPFLASVWAFNVWTKAWMAQTLTLRCIEITWPQHR